MSFELVPNGFFSQRSPKREMDDHTVMWDVVWRPILSLSFLFQCSARDALRMLCTVRQLSRAHKRLECDLWDELDVPFLRHVAFPYAFRMLWCELVQRRFLLDVERLVTDVTRRGVCVAGGFAAWRFQRCFDARHGGDGYPRAMRQTSVSDGYVRREVWVPSDVNVFVETGDDDDLVLEAIGTRYVFFCSQMFNDPRVVTSGPTCTHEEDVVTAIDLAQCLDEFEFGQDVRRMCRDQLFLDRFLEETHSAISGRSYSLYASKHEPLVPTRLTVTFTDGPPQRNYDARVLTSFDLAHCKIACRVNGETGAYIFRGADVCETTLSQRRIQLTDGSLTRSRASLRETLQRIRLYIERGFSVRGEHAFYDCTKKVTSFDKVDAAV
jgi:hypothetical protein